MPDLTGASLPTGSVIIIEETSGLKGRKATLVGPALPFAGASWRTSNKVVTDWNPGNGVEATQQVLGPREMPASWEGAWRRNMMVRTPSFIQDAGRSEQTVNVPADLRDFLDRMFFEGARLRVTWVVNKTEVIPAVTGALNAPTAFQFKVVREGRATEWEFPHDRPDDIRWRITFEWVGRGGAIAQRVVSTRDTDPNALGAQVSAAINGFNNQVPGPGASPITLGQLEALAAAPTNYIAGLQRNLLQLQSRFAEVSSLAQKLRATPFQIANGFVGMATTVVTTVNQFRDTFSGTPAEQMTLSNNVSDLMRATKLAAKSQESARTVGRAAADARLRARPALSTNPGGGANSPQARSAMLAGGVLAVYVTRDGDTPQFVAQRFYRSADRAVDILKTNGLPWGLATFTSGTVLIIPTLSGYTSGTGTP